MAHVSMISSSQSRARQAAKELSAQGWSSRPGQRLSSALITITCDEADRDRALAAIRDVDPEATPNLDPAPAPRR